MSDPGLVSGMILCGLVSGSTWRFFSELDLEKIVGPAKKIDLINL